MLFLAFNSLTVFAQKSAIYTNNQSDFEKAILLYNNKQFLAAQLLFENSKTIAINNLDTSLQADCAYFAANCAIRLKQPGADVLMENFVNENPTSPKTNMAFAEVAQYYFAQGQYPQALQWFEKVNEAEIDAEQADAFYFEKGYTYFTAKNKKQATAYFNKVANSPEFGSQAKYYLGFLAYEADNYAEANKQFNQVKDQDRYREKMSYFQSDMNFKLGNFQKAIDLGLLAMEKSNETEKSELSKIIGESYFNLKQFDKAIPFLAQYKGKKGKFNNTDFYLLGYSYYKTADFVNAISQFNKIIAGNDFVAQNAYYHLGESYLKSNQKPQALNAFKNASEMDFDPKIKEDATLNYAKLSFEIGNAYQAVPEILNQFLEKYPNNANKVEVEALLLNSYISSKNYKAALVMLEKNKTNKEAYQKVTFYRGLELFADNNFTEAGNLFKKSIATPINQNFFARATFWKAETDFTENNFEAAAQGFEKFVSLPESKTTPENATIFYNTAYTNFKLKKYDLAAADFQKFVAQPNTEKLRLTDAYLRLGDCLFVTTKYWPAMDAYTKVIDLKGLDTDYAAFQKAICYGFVNKNDKKIENLQAFIQKFEKSDFADDAVFELGNTFVTQSNTTQAIATFDKLLNQYPNSIFSAKAILKQGLIYYNADKDELALDKFKKVTSQYPGSPEALEAVATARLIYVDSGRVDEYATWVKSLNFVQVTDVALENDTFEAAEKQYQQNNTKQAIAGFSSYVKQFPKGNRALKANFYLAQMLLADQQQLAAISPLEFVILQPKNEFTEQALVKLSNIFINNKQTEKAIVVLKRLEVEADFQQNKTFAQANLMKIFYEKQDFSNAVVAAEKVLLNPKFDEKVKSDAQIIVARSAFKNNDDGKAKAAYAKLVGVAKGELAAESLYFEAYYKNKEGKLEASNQSIQKLSKNYSSYKYYGAKSLVLMAKNFYGLKDAFQANYILETVIKNFSEFADVVSEAKTEQERIKTEESKTNSSIQK